jgi:hypothetical protein
LSDRELVLIDLLARMMCVGFAARKLGRYGLHGWMGRPWAARLLGRLADPATRIGAVP